MTTAEAAKELETTARVVRKLVEDGLLQATKEPTPRGPVIYIERAEMLAFRERQAAALKAKREGKRPGRPPSLGVKAEGGEES